MIPRREYVKICASQRSYKYIFELYSFMNSLLEVKVYKTYFQSAMYGHVISTLVLIITQSGGVYLAVPVHYDG